MISETMNNSMKPQMAVERGLISVQATGPKGILTLVFQKLYERPEQAVQALYDDMGLEWGLQQKMRNAEIVIKTKNMVLAYKRDGSFYTLLTASGIERMEPVENQNPSWSELNENN